MSRFNAISRAHFLRTIVPTAAACGVLGPRIALADEPGGQLGGVYRYVGGPKQKEALARSIDEVVSKMNFMFRNMARYRLERGLEPKPRLGLDLQGDELTLSTPGMPRLVGPTDGRPFKYTNLEGKTVTVRLELDEDELRVRYIGDGSDSRYRYRFSADLRRFDLHGTIDHVRMPSTLRYRLSYSR